MTRSVRQETLLLWCTDNRMTCLKDNTLKPEGFQFFSHKNILPRNQFHYSRINKRVIRSLIPSRKCAALYIFLQQSIFICI